MHGFPALISLHLRTLGLTKTRRSVGWWRGYCTTNRERERRREMNGAKGTESIEKNMKRHEKRDLDFLFHKSWNVIFSLILKTISVRVRVRV